VPDALGGESVGLREHCRCWLAARGAATDSEGAASRYRKQQPCELMRLFESLSQISGSLIAEIVAL